MVSGIVYPPGPVLVFVAVRQSAVLFAGRDLLVAETAAAISTVFAVVAAATSAAIDRKLAKPPVVAVW